MKFPIKLDRNIFEFKDLKKIWIVELTVVGAMLAVFLGWDIWIYFKLAETGKNPEVSADTSKVVSLKKSDLEDINKKLDAYEDFLKNL